MALVKCPKCGQMVSNRASECPHCGAPVEIKTEEKTIICEECGQVMPNNATECPHCGAPVEIKTEEKPIICEECGQVVPYNATECPECGCPIHSEEIVEEAFSEERTIICEECGQVMPDNASECPNCGAPVEIKTEEKTIICEECGQVVPDNVTECPECGCPIHSEEMVEEDFSERTTKTKPNRKPLIIVSAYVLFAILIGCGVWLYSSKFKEDVVKITPEFCKAIQNGNYHMVGDFHDGLAAVQDATSRKWGFIDTKGKLVIPCKLPIPEPYERGFYPYYYSGGLIGVTDKEGYDSKYGFIDKTGKQVIPIIYGYVGNFSDGLAVIEDPNTEKYGYINKKGKVVIPAQYLYVRDFSEGLAAVKDAKSEKWGYIDKKGKVVIPYQYYEAGDFSCGVAAVEDDGPQINFIDKSGNVSPKLSGKYSTRKYSNVSEVAFVDNYCMVSNSNGSDVWINKNGEEVKEPQFPYIWVEEEWKRVGDIFEGGYETPERLGYKDGKGNVIVPAKYSRLGKFSNGVATATLSSNYTCNADMHDIYGYVDQYGNDTFSDADHQKIAQWNKEREDEKKATEELKRSGPDWLQGAWMISFSPAGDVMYYKFDHGTIYEKLFFVGNEVIEMTHHYTYSNGQLQLEPSKNAPTVGIDTYNKRVLTANGKPMTKVSETEFQQCGSKETYSNNAHDDWARKEATRAGNTATEINNMLAELLRIEDSFQLSANDVLRAQQLKQSILLAYDELISIAERGTNKALYLDLCQKKQNTIQLFHTLRF